MKPENEHAVGKCFGSTVVGPRGQLVIPVEARKELGIDAGTKLLAFGQFGDRGLVFVKVEAVEELLNLMTQKLAEFARSVTESEAADIKTEHEGD